MTRQVVSSMKAWPRRNHCKALPKKIREFRESKRNWEGTPSYEVRNRLANFLGAAGIYLLISSSQAFKTVCDDHASLIIESNMGLRG